MWWWDGCEHEWLVLQHKKPLNNRWGMLIWFLWGDPPNSDQIWPMQSMKFYQLLQTWKLYIVEFGYSGQNCLSWRVPLNPGLSVYGFNIDL